jgi:NAD+ kinase
VVDSADREYTLSTPNARAETSLVVDGQLVDKLGPHDRVVIRRAGVTFKMVRVAGHGYYRTLREKLGWGGGLAIRDK